MRPIFLLPLLFPFPVFSDTIEATSKITSVTIYPQGAEITRTVSFTAPAGPHNLIITDLPQATQPELLRLFPAKGLQIGAYSLRSDRLPPREEPLSKAQKAAKAEVEQLESDERNARAAIDAINARIEAAASQVAFLRGLEMPDQPLDPGGVETLRGISRMVAEETLAANQASLAAKAELFPAEKGLTDVLEDLQQARAAFDALARPDASYAALGIAIAQPVAGNGHLTVTHFVPDAYWQPVYDLKLTRTPAPALTIARGALVTQYSGEDWDGVRLTLSTAQPSAQAAPSMLWPELRRIEPDAPEPEPAPTAKEGEAIGAAADALEVTVNEEANAYNPAIAALEGEVIVYHVGGEVSVVSGVENLRVALDDLEVEPEIRAVAVPRLDQTAFMQASFANDTSQVLLPGTAYLMREGTLVGSIELQAILPGEEADIAFGAIDGLRLTRDMPTRSESDTGILTRSAELEENAVLSVENLTDETWPVRLLDQVPYSEQDDLEITYAAEPVPTETDVDGQRGILAWEFDLAPQETRQISLSHALSWPEEMVLR